MIPFRDPPRLLELEEAPRELRSWLEHAHRDGLSTTAIEQLIEAVESHVGAAVPSGHGLTGSAQPLTAASPGVGGLVGTWPLLTKVIVILSTVGLGLGIWHTTARHRDLPITGSQPAEPRSGVLSNIPSAAVQEVTGPTPSNIAENATGQERVVQPMPPPTRAHIQTGTAVVRATHAPASKVALPANQPMVSPPASTAQAAEGAEEHRLLRAARQAMSSDPTRALALSAEHSQRFPRGILGQESEAIAIEALARLGRTGEAKSRLTRFLILFPASPYRARLEATVSPSDKQGAGP